MLNRKAYTTDVQRALREKTKETKRDLDALREERREECEDALSTLGESLRLVEVSFDVFKREVNDREQAEKIFPSTYTRTFEERRQQDQIQLENRLRDITKEMRKALSRKIDTEKCEAILRDKVDEMSFVECVVVQYHLNHDKTNRTRTQVLQEVDVKISTVGVTCTNFLGTGGGFHKRWLERSMDLAEWIAGKKSLCNVEY